MFASNRIAKEKPAEEFGVDSPGVALKSEPAAPVS